VLRRNVLRRRRVTDANSTVNRDTGGRDAARQNAAEFVGTAFLTAGVVGSGIMAEDLSGGNAALALLANTLATGGVLFAVIAAFAPISGAHFNPLVTLEAARRQELAKKQALPRACFQFLGAMAGVTCANAMFGLSPLEASNHIRSGGPQWLGEIVATFGLLTVVRLAGSPATVACYIVAAYWFTSSTSFANPAVTFARAFSDTFAGIRLSDVPAFIVCQSAGWGLAAFFTQYLKSGAKT